MARRKQEAQLQVEIESTEEFEDMMNKEGLTGKGHVHIGKRRWR